MRFDRRLIALLLALLLVACGDDGTSGPDGGFFDGGMDAGTDASSDGGDAGEDGGDEDGGGDAGEDGGVDDGGSDDAATDGGGDASTDGGNDASTDGGAGDGGETTSASFWVRDTEGQALEAVSLSVEGSEEEPSESDEEGYAELRVPGDGVYLVRFEGAQVLTTLHSVEVTGGIAVPDAVALLPSSFIEDLEAVLELLLLPDHGLVYFNFMQVNDGGQSVSLPSGSPYVVEFDPVTEVPIPVSGGTLPPGGGEYVFYVNVPEGPFTPTITGADENEGCSVVRPPTLGWWAAHHALTSIDVECVAIP